MNDIIETVVYESTIGKYLLDCPTDVMVILQKNTVTNIVVYFNNDTSMNFKKWNKGDKVFSTGLEGVECAINDKYYLEFGKIKNSCFRPKFVNLEEDRVVKIVIYQDLNLFRAKQPKIQPLGINQKSENQIQFEKSKIRFRDCENNIQIIEPCNAEIDLKFFPKQNLMCIKITEKIFEERSKDIIIRLDDFIGIY